MSLQGFDAENNKNIRYIYVQKGTKIYIIFMGCQTSRAIKVNTPTILPKPQNQTQEKPKVVKATVGQVRKIY